MGPAEIREFCPIDNAGRSLLRAHTPAPRADARVADLAGVKDDPLETTHLAEAIQSMTLTALRAASAGHVYRHRWQV